MELPLREQGVLLTAVRGCDLTPKFPLDSLERRLVGAIRGNFMVPADPRELDREPGCFMASVVPNAKAERFSALGHYPTHWLTHVMHACEVLGYRHPNQDVKTQWQLVYMAFCEMLHVRPEQFEDYVHRLSEDRIAKGNVVQ